MQAGKFTTIAVDSQKCLHVRLDNPFKQLMLDSSSNDEVIRQHKCGVCSVGEKKGQVDTQHESVLKEQHLQHMEMWIVEKMLLKQPRTFLQSDTTANKEEMRPRICQDIGNYDHADSIFPG